MNTQLVRGTPFFTQKTTGKNDFSSLQQSISSDVVIVGGGITGALCAYYFSKQDIKTVLVEKNKIALSSTSISTSLLQYELDELIQDLEKNYNLNNIIRGYNFTKQGMSNLKKIIDELNIECDYQTRDCLTFTDDKNKIDKLKYEYLQRLQNGFDVEFIDSNTPGFDFSFNIVAGVYSRNGGAEINPVKFTKQLISKVAQMGCDVYENTEIVDYKHLDDYVQLFTSNNLTITCKRVIVATGYDISVFSSKKYCSLYTSYNIVTCSLDHITGWNNRCLIKTAEKTYTYLRTTNDNRVIIGGEDTRFIPEFLEDSIADKKYEKLSLELKAMFPHLNFSIDYKYNGAFGTTDDNLPYIGPDPKNKNIWYCLGYGANGILFSVNGAKMLSDLYKGILDEDLSLVSINR